MRQSFNLLFPYLQSHFSLIQTFSWFCSLIIFKANAFSEYQTIQVSLMKVPFNEHFVIPIAFATCFVKFLKLKVYLILFYNFTQNLEHQCPQLTRFPILSQLFVFAFQLVSLKSWPSLKVFTFLQNSQFLILIRILYQSLECLFS